MLNNIPSFSITVLRKAALITGMVYVLSLCSQVIASEAASPQSVAAVASSSVDAADIDENNVALQELKLKTLIENNRHAEGMLGQGPEDSPQLIIPIVAIVFGVGGSIGLIILLAWFHYRERARRTAFINANIDKLLVAGRDIPIELLRGDEAISDDGVNVNSAAGNANLNIHLQKGIKQFLLGIALFFVLYISWGFEAGSLAFILIALGASKLIVWSLSKKTHTPAQG